MGCVWRVYNVEDWPLLGITKDFPEEVTLS